jgi:acetyl esterase/lipase
MTDPDVDRTLDRRSVLAGLGAASSLALAGCQTPTLSGSASDSGGEADDTNTGADEASGEDDAGTDDEDADAWTVDEDIPFRETPQRTLHADVYAPTNLAEPPVLVHAHGGAWRFGEKGYHPLFGELARAGYAVADVQYRLSDETTYPGPVRDVAAAVRWVRATADERGVDPDAVALAGYSAGGHLAALVATAPRAESLQPSEFYPETDPTVAALVGNAGVYDFTAPGYGNSALIQQLLDGTRSERPERYAEASPVEHVDADDPPTLLCHGTADRVVPFDQSERFAAALGDAGVDVERLTVDGAGHLFYNAGRRLDAIAEAQISFLDDVL